MQSSAAVLVELGPTPARCRSENPSGCIPQGALGGPSEGLGIVHGDRYYFFFHLLSLCFSRAPVTPPLLREVKNWKESMRNMKFPGNPHLYAFPFFVIALPRPNPPLRWWFVRISPPTPPTSPRHPGLYCSSPRSILSVPISKREEQRCTRRLHHQGGLGERWDFGGRLVETAPLPPFAVPLISPQSQHMRASKYNNRHSCLFFPSRPRPRAIFPSIPRSDWKRGSWRRAGTRQTPHFPPNSKP